MKKKSQFQALNRVYKVWVIGGFCEVDSLTPEM